MELILNIIVFLIQEQGGSPTQLPNQNGELLKVLQNIDVPWGIVGIITVGLQLIKWRIKESVSLPKDMIWSRGKVIWYRVIGGLLVFTTNYFTMKTPVSIAYSALWNTLCGIIVYWIFMYILDRTFWSDHHSK